MDMQIKNVNRVMFPFQLFHEIDVHRILDMAP